MNFLRMDSYYLFLPGHDFFSLVYWETLREIKLIHVITVELTSLCGAHY